MEKTKIDLISGFLGAGKTTFLKKLVQDVYQEEKVVILENEFGRINIDQETLNREGLIVKPIQAGCICCSSSMELSKGILEIMQEYAPDRIVIEPTGIAKLSELKKLLQSEAITKLCETEHILTIVDAKNYYTRTMISKEFFEDQIRSSKIIFLSKTQDLEKEWLLKVKEAILQIQPDCSVISDPWDTISGERLSSIIDLKLTDKLMQDKLIQDKLIMNNQLTGQEINSVPTIENPAAFSKDENIITENNTGKKMEEKSIAKISTAKTNNEKDDNAKNHNTKINTKSNSTKNSIAMIYLEKNKILGKYTPDDIILMNCMEENEHQKSYIPENKIPENKIVKHDFEKKHPIKFRKNYANDFDRHEFLSEGTIGKAQMNQFIQSIQDGRYGEIHRLKGICRDPEGGSYSVDYVPGETVMNDLQSERMEPEHLRICLIGRKIEHDRLEECFRFCIR
jgi:Putative GTPases (G3E family)